ncbi:MAG: hypothetical protein PSV23_08910 [Brevundimonas sp.]|uniref:hypothetical protein n=1 Tax=Brevundimonas sp. TaxID=1871086 RepID=UPI002489197C|nr:hypothetical protein [Brevundimonas sp.]MDI1326901.1 hypothetical protein [Brevundimonas sp.]
MTVIHPLPIIPAKAGTQFFGRSGAGELAQTAIPRTRASRKHRVPAFAGMHGIKIEGLAA